MTFFLNGYFFSNTLHISIVHIYNAYINVNCVWGCAHPLRPFRQPTNSSETVQLSSPHTTTTMRRTSVWFEKSKKKVAKLFSTSPSVCLSLRQFIYLCVSQWNNYILIYLSFSHPLSLSLEMCGSIIIIFLYIHVYT